MKHNSRTGLRGGLLALTLVSVAAISGTMIQSITLAEGQHTRADFQLKDRMSRRGPNL